MESQYDMRHKRREDGKMVYRLVFGVAIVGIGVLLLLKMFHLLPPIAYSFHLGWPLILIAAGLAIGVKSGFRKNAWWILILIGIVHLVPPFNIGDVPSRRIIWPLLLILAGLAMVFRKNRHHHQWNKRHQQVLTTDADTVNIDISFGGRKEIITSSNFRGGLVRASFAGVEINLASADSDIQPMILELRTSFAGIEIIVPSHWEVQNEINPTMGSVEDQRTIRTPDASMEKRKLILQGTCSFGSIEIKGY